MLKRGFAGQLLGKRGLPGERLGCCTASGGMPAGGFSAVPHTLLYGA
jgi:hypothetical protein